MTRFVAVVSDPKSQAALRGAKTMVKMAVEATVAFIQRQC